MGRHLWMRRKKRNSRSFSDPLLAAVVTALLLWIAFRIEGFVPFGTNTPAVTDAKLQYLDLFAYCRDVLTGQNSAAYTFSNTLGGGTAAIWAYYLASPFNLLVLLFKKEQMNLFLEVLITAKLSAASASFAWFAGRRFGNRICREMTLALSVGYGLMQYTLSQGSNVMWLDGVILLPFIVLGVHRAVRRGSEESASMRILGLALPAAVSVLANWYTGGINFLFSAVWFVYEEGRKAAAGRRNEKAGKELPKDLMIYLAGMGLGLLLASVLFVPNILALMEGKGASWDPAAFMSAGLRGNPFSVFRSYRIGEISDSSRVSFFCGSLALFGTTAYFLSGRIRKKEKICSALLCLFAVMSIFWQPLFMLFSLFQFSNSYWYRYAYIGSFVLLYLASCWAGSLPQEGGFRNRKQWSVVPTAGLICVLLMLVSRRIWPSGGSTSTRTAVLVLIAITLLVGAKWAPDGLFPKRDVANREAAGKDRKPASTRRMSAKAILPAALAALCIWESFLQTQAMLNIYHTDTASEYEQYSIQEQEQIGNILAGDAEGFYRINQTSTRIGNKDGLTAAYLDAMAYGYASVSGYTSCPENIQLDFLDRLGYRKEYLSFNIVNTSFLPADSLLGVRYVLSGYAIPGLEKMEEQGERNGKAVYRNPYVLPAAMILDAGESAPEAVEETAPPTSVREGTPSSADPFPYLEDLYNRLAGEEAGLFVPVSASKTYDSGTTSWALTAPEGNYCLYGNLPWNSVMEGRLTVSDGWGYGYGGWLSPAVFYIPVRENKAVVTLQTGGEPDLRDEQFYALDLDRLAQAAQKIRARAEAVRELEITNGRILCTVDALEGQSLLLSVPASKGWTASVNGQNIQIGAFEGCLMEIPLVQGENYITIRYSVPGLKAGSAMTLAAAFVCVGIIVLNRKRRVKIEKKRGDNR